MGVRTRTIRALRRQGPGIRRRLTISAVRIVLVTVVGCMPAGEPELIPRSTLVIGIDVSGSFQSDGRYDDAVAFAAHYILGHVNRIGGLEQPRALFVGAIGGDRPGQPQSFRPIHDFEGRSVPQIEADLRRWFPVRDQYTDFDVFFERAATLIKRQNLTLAPITLVLLTDGVPDTGGPRRPDDDPDRFASVDLDPLEYLARNVTVRILYPHPTVAVRWERDVPRSRVRLWTVDATVMKGWRAQLLDPDAAPVIIPSTEPTIELMDAWEAGEIELPLPQVERPVVATGPQPEDQVALWRWIHEVVNFRVRRSVI